MISGRVKKKNKKKPPSFSSKGLGHMTTLMQETLRGSREPASSSAAKYYVKGNATALQELKGSVFQFHSLIIFLATRSFELLSL